MLGECISIGDMDGPTKIEQVSANGKQVDPLSSPPLKRPKQLVQARLPFKVLTPKVPSIIPVVSPNTKKRKPSDSSTLSSQKASKAAKHSEDQSKKPNQKKSFSVSQCHGNTENEVSSSSEADTTSKSDAEDVFLTKPALPKGLMSLDKFVRTTQQLEVTTSCKDDPIVDLTDSDNEAVGKVVKVNKSNVSKNLSSEESKPTKKAVGKVVKVNKPDTSKNLASEESMKKFVKVSKPDTSKSLVSEESRPTKKADEKVGEAKKGTVVSEQNQQTDKQSKREENGIQENKEECSSAASPQQVSPKPKQEDAKNDSNADSGNENKLAGPKTRTSPSTITKPQPKTPASAKKLQQKEAEKQKKLDEKEKLRLEKLKQKEEAQKQREEKERLKKEEKERKEKEREELKKKRDQEKQAKLEQLEKEKAEKLKVREEERRKKQEILDAKTEEKKKKEEEQKKKEEEKQKALDKEAKKKQRTSAVFSKFFVKPTTSPTEDKVEKEEKGPFILFEVKSDMRVAPILRVTGEEKKSKIQALDTVLGEQNGEAVYLKDLKTGKHKPGSATKTYPSDVKESEEDEDEVIMEEEEQDKEANIIPQEEAEKLPLMKVKLLQFHENYRPPYYGTWRKQTKYIRGRNPYSKDDVLLDYDVDSDEEWEEEEPGESLSHSEGEKEEEEKKENSDDEDEGFFVPHGYLSEGEGGEDDAEEEMSPERLKAKQLAKARAWEVDMQKQVNILRAVIIGCCWYNREGPMTPQLEKLQSFKAVPLVSTPIAVTKESSPEQVSGANRKSKDKDGAKKKQSLKKAVPEEAMPDIVRLIHGNKNGMSTLLQEFREYWRRKSLGLPLTRSPEEVQQGEESSQKAGRDSPMDISQDETSPQEGEQNSPPSDDKAGCFISKRQLVMTVKSIAAWQKGTHGICWYVKESTLEQYGFKDLQLPNQWEYVTYVKPRKTKTLKVVPSLACTTAASPGPNSPIVAGSPTAQLGSQGTGGATPQEISNQPSILKAFAATPKAVRPNISATSPIVAPRTIGASPLQQRTVSAFTASPGASSPGGGTVIGTVTPIKPPPQSPLLKAFAMQGAQASPGAPSPGGSTVTPVKPPRQSPLLKAFAIQGAQASTPKSSGKLKADNDCMIIEGSSNTNTNHLPQGPNPRRITPTPQGPSPRRITPTLIRDTGKSQLTSPGSSGIKKMAPSQPSLLHLLKETSSKPSVSTVDMLKAACSKPVVTSQVKNTEAASVAQKTIILE